MGFFYVFFLFVFLHCCLLRFQRRHRHHGQHPFQMALSVHVSGYSAGPNGTAVPWGVSKEGVILHPHLPEARRCFVKSKLHSSGTPRRGRVCKPLAPIQKSKPWWWHALLSKDVSFNKWVVKSPVIFFCDKIVINCFIINCWFWTKILFRFCYCHDLCPSSFDWVTPMLLGALGVLCCTL